MKPARGTQTMFFSKIQAISIVQRVGFGSHMGIGSTWDSFRDRCTLDSILT